MDTIAETTFCEIHIALQDGRGERDLAGSELADDPLLLTAAQFDAAFNLHGRQLWPASASIAVTADGAALTGTCC